MSSTLKVDILQDSGGNNIVASDGSGNLTTQKILYPAFEAVLSASQSVSDLVTTKVQFDSVSFDTNNYYDNSTNYRFTPLVAGKYFVYTAVRARASANSGLADVDYYMYKNGSAILQATENPNSNYGREFFLNVSGVIDMNGTTDYLECFANLNAVSTNTLTLQSGGNGTRFGAYRIGD